MNEAPPDPATDARTTRSRWVLLRHGLVVLSVAGLAAVSACSSRSDEASPTLRSTTTTIPTTAPPLEEDVEDPPPQAWVVQVGSDADDAFLSVSSRRDELVAVGYTEGDLEGTNAGGRDVLIATVDTAAEVKNVRQAGTGSTEEARGVSGDDPTIACGVSGTDQAAAVSPLDAWCSSVDDLGRLTDAGTLGSEVNDEINGVGMGTNSLGYAAGFAEGFFPGASDSTAGFLGQGDALLWKLDGAEDPAWIRQFGTAERDAATSATTLGDRDALVVGDTEGDLDQTSAGGSDAFIGRFDQAGLPRWIRQFGSSGDDLATGVAAGGDRTRATETFMMVGVTDGALAPLHSESAASPELAPEVPEPQPDGGADDSGTAEANAGGTDAFVTGFDPTGRLIWAIQIGSAQDDSAAAVAVDGTTVLMAGTTSGSLDTTNAPPAGGTDGFLAGVDSLTGHVRWITQFGTPDNEVVHSVTTTGDGLAVVAGQTTGAMGEEISAGGVDGFLIAFELPNSGGAAASIL